MSLKKKLIALMKWVCNSPTSTKSSYSVVVITLDFESNNPGSNPGRSFYPALAQLEEQLTVVCVILHYLYSLLSVGHWFESSRLDPFPCNSVG